MRLALPLLLLLFLPLSAAAQDVQVSHRIRNLHRRYDRPQFWYQGRMLAEKSFTVVKQ